MKTTLTITAIVVVIALLTGCSGADTETADTSATPPSTTSDTIVVDDARRRRLDLRDVTIITDTVSPTVTVYGTLDVDAMDRAAVAPVLGGRLQQINVRPGSYVRKGELLAVVNNPDIAALQESLLVLRARKTAAEAELTRQTTLRSRDAGVGRSYETAEAELATITAQLRSREEQLQLAGISPQTLTSATITTSARVLSPLEGWVTSIPTTRGVWVSPQDTIAIVVSRSGLFATFTVFQRDIDMATIGAPFTVQLTSDSTKSLTGVIDRIVPSAANDGSVRVYGNLHTSPSTSWALPGIRIIANINGPAHPAVIVPTDAIITRGTTSFIRIRINPTTYVHTPVTVSRRIGNLTILSDADTLVGRVVGVTKGFW